MTSKTQLTFMDESGEMSRVVVNGPDATALNIASLDDNAQFGTAGGIATTIASLSLCTPVKADLVASSNGFPHTPPGSRYAQRETGLLVRYSDNVTGKMYRITIPGPDWANIGLAGSDMVNTANAAWLAFVTAFEAQCLSPDGNAVTVVDGRFVGRNR